MNNVEKRLFLTISNLVSNAPIGPTGNNFNISLLEEEYNVFINRFEKYKEGDYYIVGGNTWRVNLFKEVTNEPN